MHRRDPEKFMQYRWAYPCSNVLPLNQDFPPIVPVRSKVKMSPSHLALLGVFGSELQLERLLILRLGEVGSSGAESRSGKHKRAQQRQPPNNSPWEPPVLPALHLPVEFFLFLR